MAGPLDAGGDDHRRHRQEGFPRACAQSFAALALPAPGLGGGRAGDAVPTREWGPAPRALRRRLLSERGHTATEAASPQRHEADRRSQRCGSSSSARARNQLLPGSPLARLPTSAGSASESETDGQRGSAKRRGATSCDRHSHRRRLLADPRWAEPPVGGPRRWNRPLLRCRIPPRRRAPRQSGGPARARARSRECHALDRRLRGRTS